MSNVRITLDFNETTLDDIRRFVELTKRENGSIPVDFDSDYHGEPTGFYTYIGTSEILPDVEGY